MDKSGLAGAILEQGQNLTKATGDQVAKFAQSGVSQVTGSYDTTGLQSQPASDSLETLASQATQDDPADPQGQHAPQPQHVSQPQMAKQDVHNEQQLTAVRHKLAKELHRDTYFDPTFNPPKRAEEPVAEKLDREDQEEKMKFMDEQKKKPQSIAVQRGATRTETKSGPSG